MPADVNGDGLVDIIQIRWSPSTPLEIQSFLPTADGGFVSAGPESTFHNQKIDKQHLYPMGFNGGSQTCLLSCWLDSNKWNFSIFGSSPDGSFHKPSGGNTDKGFPSLQFFVGDANGDGKADLFYSYVDLNSNIKIQPFMWYPNTS